LATCEIHLSFHQRHVLLGDSGRINYLENAVLRGNSEVISRKTTPFWAYTVPNSLIWCCWLRNVSSSSFCRLIERLVGKGHYSHFVRPIAILSVMAISLKSWQQGVANLALILEVPKTWPKIAVISVLTYLLASNM
jgi:hypothetical protein